MFKTSLLSVADKEIPALPANGLEAAKPRQNRRIFHNAANPCSQLICADELTQLQRYVMYTD